MTDNLKHPADEKKPKFRTHSVGTKRAQEKRESIRWIIIIVFVSFFLSALLSFISSDILKVANFTVTILVVIIIIVIHIIFDIVGTSVTAADEAPFHAMASRKVYAASQAIRLIRNADKVSNFCNDVIGDIAGIISGAASTYIIITVVGNGANSDTTIMGLTITGLVAAFTVGGKAVGKAIALQNSNFIIYKVAVIINFISIKTKFIRFKKRKCKNKCETLK